MFGWSDEYLAKAVELIGPAVVYDIESFPNVFTCNVESIDKDDNYTFEISARRNDTLALVQYLNSLRDLNIPMIGYNNAGYDYTVIHFIIVNAGMLAALPGAEAAALIKARSDQVITGDRFGNTIWQDQRIVPQIDLYKIHHFDNKSKRQSLKGLEFNMRSASVLDSELPFDQPVTPDDINRVVVPYNRWDVKETKRFALISAESIAFRREMVATGMLKGDVLNFNETKLGKELLIQRLGDQLCFTWTPRKAPRQTVRTRVAMTDVVFPYITFEHPELNRVLNWIKGQVLTSSDLEEIGKEASSISTKGVFTGLTATVDGFTFVFGTGGIHGSVKERSFREDDEYHIEDIDVASLYPSVAIVNRLYPEHLGERFVEEYGGLKTERFRYAKGTTQNSALKLALNGSYGDSGSEFSPLFDKQFLLKITINGQLMLCMLAEQLMKVPTLEMIQINTDGMTYRVHRKYKDHCAALHKWWEAGTQLDLEKQYYRRMWVRDVNSYVAESVKGKLKIKGAYWYHDGLAFPNGWTEAVSKAGPSAWYKDLGAQAVQRAAVAAMVHGVDPYHWLICHRDPFDFMLRAKTDKGASLFIDDRQVQKVTRYFISNGGGRLHKIAMPTGPIGQFKPKPKVDKAGYAAWHATWGNVWNGEFHTANKSTYEMVDTALQAGYTVTECNLADQFSFANLNYGWYLDEARKLIIP